MKNTPRGKSLREQIAALEIIRALESHVLGMKKMSATQVTAALALLRKRLPDLVRRTVRAPKKKKKSEAAGHEEALKDLK